MFIESSSRFVHRTTNDGTVVSFCRECLAQVATSQWEADLDEAERNHTCRPIGSKGFEDAGKARRIRVKRDKGEDQDFREYRAASCCEGFERIRSQSQEFLSRVEGQLFIATASGFRGSDKALHDVSRS